MTFEVPDGLAWLHARDFVEWDDGLYLMKLPDGDPVVLRDTAAQIWMAAAAGDDVVHTMAEITGEEPDSIRHEVEAFVGALVQFGLLQRKDPS